MATRSDCDPILAATCTRCGDVELCVDQVELLMCSRRALSLYRFTCPICETYVCKRATEAAITLLIQYGVAVTQWLYPPELDEAHTGPPITWDDILELHLELLPI
jgi:hypothetical protein